MCGIAGIAGFQQKRVAVDEVRRMCDAIYHRGPDDQGYFYSPDVVLGMRRLSIIDLANGRQPISNEDGSIHVVFNGEIYNFQSLRNRLEARGHVFRTSSDTEVIVHAYEEYGACCVDHFRGMFVFALWDDNRRRLLLARDRLGIKPLYYGMVNGRLVFASELKAILELPGVDRRLDWESLSHLFSFLTTPRDASIIAGIKKLEPAHRLIAEPGKALRVERYWDVEFRPDRQKSESEFIEELRGLLEESVQLRMIADVPLGAFLSGGIDSSSVVAAMSKLSSRPVKTFSIGFSEQEYSELAEARTVAKHLGTEHHELVLEPDVIGTIEEIVSYLDEPFGDSSAIPTYMVSKMAAEHVKVVLSGDGGDELFAGYDRYLVEERERGATLPRPIRRILGAAAGLLPEGVRGANYLRHRALSGAARYVDSSTLFHGDQKERLFTRDAARHLDLHDAEAARRTSLRETPGHGLSRLQLHDLGTYLPLDVLTKVDRMSMAHSIEVRVPLLDHKLVEFAATIPAHMRLRDGRSKYIFRQAMRGILPDSIIDRPKRGFAIPLGRWFRGQLDNYCSTVFFSQACRDRGILNPAYLRKLLWMHRDGRDLDLHLWTLVSFELWCRQFLDTPRFARPAEMPLERVFVRTRALASTQVTV